MRATAARFERAPGPPALLVVVGGERSPSWLATLRFTSVEHLPDHNHSLSKLALLLSRRPSTVPGTAVGVLVCEA